MSITEAIAERETARRAAAQNEFRRLAAEVAAGGEPGIEAIEAALQATGKTAQEFEQQVTVQRTRREKLALVKQEPELLEQREQLRGSYEQLKAKREEFLRKWAERADREWQALHAVERQIDVITTAREWLRDNGGDTEKLARLDQIREQVAAVVAQRRAAEYWLKGSRLSSPRVVLRALQRERQGLEGDPSVAANVDRQSLDKRIAEQQATIASWQATVDTCNAQLAELQAEADGIRRELEEEF